MNYLNAILILASTLLVIEGLLRWRSPAPRATALHKFSQFLLRHEWWIFGILLVVATLVRLMAFPGIPAGFNQDEASMAIDAYNIMEHGVDRFGYHFPVYTVAWGSGHGPFLTYFTIPFLKIFGYTPLGFRLCNALLSIASVACIYLLLRKTHSRRLGFIAMGVLATSPWNIMLARWSLDSNPLPSLFIIATCVLVHAIGSRPLWRYALSGLVFALVLYAYGTSYVMVPLFLLGTGLLLLYYKQTTVRQAMAFGISFCVGALPLVAFVAVNYLRLPEIRTALFSIPRHTAMRSASVFRPMDDGWTSLVESAQNALEVVFWQGPDYVWNNVRQFGNLYLFATPLILLGAILLVRRAHRPGPDSLYNKVYAIMLGSALVLSLLLYQNVNRCSIVFVPLVLLVAFAIDYLLKKLRWAGLVLGIAYLVSFAAFANYYFQSYNQLIGPNFYESFDEAIHYATQITKDKIYVTEDHINGSWVLVLYYTNTPYQEFMNTVEFREQNVEFRAASHFGRFVFDTPRRFPPNAVCLVNNSELALFPRDRYVYKQFKFFSVVVPREQQHLLAAHPGDEFALHFMQPLEARQDWGSPQMGFSLDNNPLRIGTQTFAGGIGTHAFSRLVYAIPPQACAIELGGGVDAEVGNLGRVQFQVHLDGRKMWQSEPMEGGDEATHVKILLKGEKTLELIVDSLEDNKYDHADWVDARFLVSNCTN